MQNASLTPQEWDRIAQLTTEYATLQAQIATETAWTPEQLDRSRRAARLQEVVHQATQLRQHERWLTEAFLLQEEARTTDTALALLAAEECADLRVRIQEHQRRIRECLGVPGREASWGVVLLEIRAGSGGAEAALWAGDLLRMYLRFALREGWSSELQLLQGSPGGGVREVVVRLEGSGLPDRLRWEGGPHRIQRVSATDTHGRVHTSTAIVAVLPEASAVEVPLREEDIQLFVCRAHGHGGQGVNRTDSAVRLRHLPTGLVVSCQDERSQHTNRERALTVLRSRLLARAQQEQHAERGVLRRLQTGDGRYAEKVRTYTVRENRVTDHRLGRSLRALDRVLGGELDLLLERGKEPASR